MTKYNQVTPEIAAQLQAIVGAKRFFAGDAVKDICADDSWTCTAKPVGNQLKAMCKARASKNKS